MAGVSTAPTSEAFSCHRKALPRSRPTKRGGERYHSTGCGRGELMAGALRPVVLLMLLASVLFVLDGILYGVYPGGPAWFTGKYNNLAEIAYIFAIVNTAVAYLVARGSERSLMARIGLSAFFLIERPLTAFILGPKELPAVVVHLATALVELVILVSAVRVWRLGHSVGDAEMDSLFGLQSSSPMPVRPAMWTIRRPARSHRGCRRRRPGCWASSRSCSPRSSWRTASSPASHRADEIGDSPVTPPAGSSISSRSWCSPSPRAPCMAAYSRCVSSSRPRSSS